MFGLGTYKMGGADDQVDITAIKTAIELGITHIDSAERYADGHSEELVGQAIKNHDRKKLFLTSKVNINNLSYQGVHRAIIGSLNRTQAGYFDLYFLHRYPGSDDKLRECIKAMTELKQDGLIHHMAISNFNLEHTKQAMDWSNGLIVATQVHYSLRFREPEATGLLEYCQKNDTMLIAWRPLGLGILEKGKLNFIDTPLLMDMSNKYQKTPLQIAINWLISQPNVVTLTKTSTIKHLKENIGAVGWKMREEDVEKLRRGFPDQKIISDTVPLA